MRRIVLALVPLPTALPATAQQRSRVALVTPEVNLPGRGTLAGVGQEPRRRLVGLT